MADPVIGLFMEDVAHENFIKCIVSRIASDRNISVRFEVRNATGGIPRMRRELSGFLRDHARVGNPIFDILIVVQDADRNSVSEIKSEIQRHIERSGYPGRIIAATPSPYIEAWYLADPVSVQKAGGSPNLIQIPRRESGKDTYKTELSRAFQHAPLGGIEYADDIVQNMNLYNAGQNVSSLRQFIDDPRSTLTQLASETEEQP